MVYEPRLNTLICWKTRDERRAKQIEILCRDYGLVRLLTNIYLGRLTRRERGELYTKFSEMFTNKTDAFHFITLCQFCFNSAMITDKQKFHDHPSFEVV